MLVCVCLCLCLCLCLREGPHDIVCCTHQPCVGGYTVSV